MRPKFDSWTPMRVFVFSFVFLLAQATVAFCQTVADSSGGALNQLKAEAPADALPAAAPAVSPSQKEDSTMKSGLDEKKMTSGKVVDLGGAFIYASDPKSLAAWYVDVLGIPLAFNPGEGDYWAAFSRKGDAPKAVFAIKPAEGALSTPRNQFMVNFLIDDFDSLVVKLKAKGVNLDKDVDYPNFGRFGWIKDLEGNPIQFWQPK